MAKRLPRKARRKQHKQSLRRLVVKKPAQAGFFITRFHIWEGLSICKLAVRERSVDGR
jgi:hypothetical protein